MTTQNAPSRERGTLDDTLPKPYPALFLFWLMCTATAVYTHIYSSLSNEHDIQKIVMILVQAGLGVLSSMIAVIYNDTFVRMTAYSINVRVKPIFICPPISCAFFKDAFCQHFVLPSCFYTYSSFFYLFSFGTDI